MNPRCMVLFFLLLGFLSNQVVAGTSKRFIFRQDDVEDWYHNTIQAELLNWFMDNNVPVSAGIIGDNVSGDDNVIMTVLNRCVAQGYDNCALWNHNSNHSFIFGTMAKSVAQAQAEVAKCDQKIKTLFPGYQPFLMCPPTNSWNNYLIQALKNLGYKIVSASTLDYSNMAWDLTTSPMQMPQQTQTGDWDDNKGKFIAYPIASTVADCEAAAAAGQVCVIMTHPHEFASGAYTFPMLSNLVQSLYNAGFTATNFYTVMNEQLGLSSSPTAKPTQTPTRKPTVFGQTNSPTISPTAKPGDNNNCGPDYGNTFCGDSTQPCCSQYGWCGIGTGFCDTGCQAAYGVCNSATPVPSAVPSRSPITGKPTITPTAKPSPTPINSPTAAVSGKPTATPTTIPTRSPTTVPTAVISQNPSATSTLAPTTIISSSPTAAPSVTLTTSQTLNPTAIPTTSPTTFPTIKPTPVAQTTLPTVTPTVRLTAAPSTAPTAKPSSPKTSSPTASQSVVYSTNGRCGAGFGNTVCGDSTEPCCSQYGWCGATGAHCGIGCQSPYGHCNVIPTISPTAAPTTAPTYAQTLQYTVILVVSNTASWKFSADNQQALVNTITYFETGQNLLSASYLGLVQIISRTQFSVAVTLTFGINTVNSASVRSNSFSSTTNPIEDALITTQFSDVYHAMGTDKSSAFTLVRFTTDNVNTIGSSHRSSSSGSSAELSTKSIGGIATGSFIVSLLIFVAVYFWYQRRTRKNQENERIKSFRTESSEELIEGHYSIPLSDRSSMEYVENNMIVRHGLKLSTNNDIEANSPPLSPMTKV